MTKAWVNKTTGAIRPFFEGEVLPGYGPDTDDLIDCPSELFDGLHDWDPVTRSVVLIPPPVPDSVTPRQMRLALIQQGLYDQIEAFVQSQDQATQISWDYATQIDRDNALVGAACTALGKTETDLDNLFILAATL